MGWNGDEDMEMMMLFLVGVAQRLIGTLAGSGGLISFPAMMLLGVPVHATIAANKLSTSVGSFSNFWVLVRKKQLNKAHLWHIAPFAIAGGLVGSLFASLLDEQTLTVMAVFLLCFAFILAFLKKPDGNKAFHDKLTKPMHASFFGTSVYNGAFGPGQGTLLMYLLFYEGVPYISAIGLNQISTFVSGVAATVVFIASGAMVWHIALPLTLGSMLGAQIAIRIAHKLSTQHVKWLLRLITFFLIIQLIIELF